MTDATEPAGTEGAAGVVVRSMMPDDRTAVVGLFREFIRHEAGLDPAISPFVQDRTRDPDEAEHYLSYSESLITRAHGQLVVAELEGEVVGFLCWSIGSDGPFVRPEFRKLGEVSFVVTREDCRGLGIGTSLMAEAERLTRAAGLNRLSLMVMTGNRGAVKLYERLGFESRANKMLKRVSR